ncbi:MAG: hypothetical protein JSR15_09150 [Proteobacteria bacterium]|nr:hypothetical protein [Pseudomonadota bacterium]
MPLRAWFLLAIFAAMAAPAADDRCAGFTWNVQTELAVFARHSARIQAGSSAAAPFIGKARAYRLSLTHQSAVQFATDPGKYSDADGRFAGLIRVRIARAGRYRVSLDADAWIDVVADGRIVPAAAYTGSQECALLRKVLEFQLPAGTATIQVSDSEADHVRLAVTASTYRPAT